MKWEEKRCIGEPGEGRNIVVKNTISKINKMNKKNLWCWGQETAFAPSVIS